MQTFLLHTFLVANIDKSPYCFLLIFSIHPNGFSTGGTGFFHLSVLGEVPHPEVSVDAAATQKHKLQKEFEC